MSFLSTNIIQITGIGKYYASLLNKYGIRTYLDLLWTFPSKKLHLEITYTPLSSLIDQKASLQLTINSVMLKTTPRLFTILSCTTLSNESIQIIFFMKSPLFYKNSKITVAGLILSENKLLKMKHPKWAPGHTDGFFDIEYPYENVPSGIISKSIQFIVQNYNHILLQYFCSIHTSHNEEEVEYSKNQLKYYEAIAYNNAVQEANRSISLQSDDFRLGPADVSDLIGNFDYKMTPCQDTVWEEIKQDLESNKRMLRMLYGDVGSGKTAIATLALGYAYKAGKQAALLVPTEILAQQHYAFIQKIMPNENIVLLTGNSKSKKIYSKIQEEICIIIGTHALLQDKVKYNNLGLVVIDEQHRFGVMQRISADPTLSCNVLLMTATPIPRTLQLSLNKVIPISQILSRPQQGRRIEAHLLKMSEIEDMYNIVQTQLLKDDNIFWVCPFIVESKKAGGDILTRHAALEARFPGQVGYLHGRLKPQSKDEILAKFYNKEIRILVAPTIIEVGINIPHANTIIIENAELFGMAQLYQLMGRVGRGTEPGTCYFLHAPTGKDAMKRLKALQICQSGLELAEQDLYIRGFGSLLGTEQSGEHYFRILDPTTDSHLLVEALNTTEMPVNLDEILEIYPYLSEAWNSG